MARRRGKGSSKQDDSWLSLEPTAGQSCRSLNEYIIPAVLLIIIAVGGSGLGWVYSDHQQTIESLSETLATMQARITKLQQQLGPDNSQFSSVGGFEERLVALEDAYAKAQRQVELALSTSQQIKSKDLQSKVWSLQNEINDKMAELQQNTISIAALNAIIKNKSVDLEVVKQSVNTILSADTELAIQISGFSSMLSATKLRLDEQISVVDNLRSQLEDQKGEINEIKKLFASNQESLTTYTKELIDVKDLLESEQIKRTQNLEKQLKSLYKRLEDHQTNSESIHFHLAAQLEALQIQSLAGDQQHRGVEEQNPNEDKVTASDYKDTEAPEKQLENTDAEFTEEEKIQEDRSIQEDESIMDQSAFEIEFEEDDRHGEELEKETQTPSNENEIEETDITEMQTDLENSDHVTFEMEAMRNEKLEVPVKEKIEFHSEIQSNVKTKTEMQIEVATETQEAAVEKEVAVSPAQEMQTRSEAAEKPYKPDEVLSEDNAKEEIHNVSNEASAEMRTLQDDTELESGTEINDVSEKAGTEM